ncbi:Uncharacterised protein [uncultured archaeon]|nr:Uncharacterised protein [uncultured archaeon]
MRKKRSDENAEFYGTVANIKEKAETGKSIVKSMGSLKKTPFSFDSLHFVPAQVAKMPLTGEEPVNTSIAIGPKAKKPLEVSTPILVSGLSFGAVSKNVRLVISRAAAKLGFGFNSGEGGVLEEELQVASKLLITQYSTDRFGITDTLLKNSAAIEIRFGQGAYPGKGSYLPAAKMTEEVAKARGLKPRQAAYSPARHPDMASVEDVKKKVDYLRAL